MASYSNQATLAYNGSVTNSNIVTGNVTSVVDATKTAVGGTYKANDVVTYIVSITNSGTTDVTGLQISDNLGSYTISTNTAVPLTYVSGTAMYYVNGTLQTTPTVTAGPPLVISGISVPADGNAIVIYQAKVNEYAPVATGGTINNVATVTGTGIDAIEATETINASTEALLSISKSASPENVAAGDQMTFTFLLQNSGAGSTKATDNLVLTDAIEPILSNISVTFNGTAWTANTNYTYDATTGEFTTLAGQLSVPAASYSQNTTTGAWTTTPGVSTLVITGTA